MYFSIENAIIIDFIRFKIDEWFLNKLINNNEKTFLIASLIESISKVSNIAGVYGAYLKKWDNRAIKRMKFVPITNVESSKPSINYNSDILDLIDKIEGDIIYLDPPYTKNKYTSQYHLLENIALNKNPILKGITGTHDMTHYANDFTINGKVHIAFETLIRKAKFKHIVFSYSSMGLMSKEYISAVLKRYGKESTYLLKEIPYKKYKNHHSEEEELFEYIFYIEKKDLGDFNVASPLNYIGGKADIINFVKDNIGLEKINTFYDLFGGGFNVGSNIKADKVVYNELNHKVKEMIAGLIKDDVFLTYQFLNKKIKKYSLVKKCKEEYIKFRNDYNNSTEKDYKSLYLLILYSFQQQIRFNSSLGFNNTSGQSSFNDKILEKLISFHQVNKNKNIVFKSLDYEEYEKEIKKGDLVYLDPPYLITLGSYNDGKRGFKGWNETEEIRLYNFLDRLNKKGIKFVLSNVIEHKEKVNNILKEWLDKNNYYLSNIPKIVKNRKEVIIRNFKV
jgi:adenine-specific DNA-methyltransferase